jgi:serine/threonine protein kinase
MTTKHAEDEFNQIQKFNQLLSIIPNYNNFFLLDNFQLCKPNKLTKDDLIGFKKKCKTLKKKGINSTNINKLLDELSIINMPNGGINIEHFISIYFSASHIIRLNNSLINLLVNGIIPMNKLNVYHCDIKDANILVDITQKQLLPKLIDWGLSIFYDDKKRGIPYQLYRRPFQFNVPFSSILFNKHFISFYNKFLQNNTNPNYFQIREFIINYIFIWNNIRGSGHLSAINEFIKKLTIHNLPAIKKKKIKNHFVEYNFTYYYIIEYLSKIVEKYTNNGKLDLMVYFENIFLKNIDIWGFTMVYISFYEYLYSNFDELNKHQIKFINKIKYIIIHFLYEDPLTVIDTSSLVNELTNLNTIILKFTIGGNKKTYKKKMRFNKTMKKLKI